MIRQHKELLSYLTKHQQELDGFVHLLHIEENTQIIRQGKWGTSVFVIKEGLAKCYRTEENGKIFIQEFFGEGWLFGELEVIQEQLSICVVEAITPMLVYQIPTDSFQHLLTSNTYFNQLIINALASKVTYKAVRHAFYHSYAVKDKLLHIQKNSPEAFDKVSKQDLANYLGITLRSLNRALNQLKQKE